MSKDVKVVDKDSGKSKFWAVILVALAVAFVVLSVLAIFVYKSNMMKAALLFGFSIVATAWTWRDRKLLRRKNNVYVALLLLVMSGIWLGTTIFG
jgi:uncharacterized membrane protein YoaK (UPF0700 family)